MEGDGIHACWHENRETNPHIDLTWEAKDEVKAEEGHENAENNDVVHLVESLRIGELLIDHVD